MEKYGQQPARFLAFKILEELECDSFDDFVDRYQKMEKFLRFQPSAFTDSATKEHEDMRHFIDAALAVKKEALADNPNAN